jgi:hypothetical protein
LAGMRLDAQIDAALGVRAGGRRLLGNRQGRVA